MNKLMGNMRDERYTYIITFTAPLELLESYKIGHKFDLNRPANKKVIGV